MEEIEKKLIEIINTQLEICNKNSIAPSKEVLDTINTLIMLRNII